MVGVIKDVEKIQNQKSDLKNFKISKNLIRKKTIFIPIRKNPSLFLHTH